MAISRNNPLLKNVHGKLGKTVVFKTYWYGTVISNYPDMSKVKPSKNQIKEKDRFRDAVRYAQSVNNNPELKAKIKATLHPGRSVYHACISEYMGRAL
jgi:hypothetical protein